LTQIPVVAAAVVVILFYALAWRKRHPPASPSLFGLFQIGLVFWIIVALSCLYAAIHTGLLLKPDMQVAGNGSSDTLLRFYADQVQGLTPAIRVISLPLWIYRVVMLLWSLWLAASLVRWSRWTWQCLSEGGLWRAHSAPKSGSGSVESTHAVRNE
jgi:hypothetical protein